MTIEITNPELEAQLRQLMRARSLTNPEDLLREILPAPASTQLPTSADLIAAMQSCPYPEVELEPHRLPLLVLPRQLAN